MLHLNKNSNTFNVHSGMHVTINIEPSNHFTKFVKNVKILEFHDHIRIKISTNMHRIGSLIREIAVKMSEM